MLVASVGSLSRPCHLNHKADAVHPTRSRLCKDEGSCHAQSEHLQPGLAYGPENMSMNEGTGQGRAYDQVHAAI